MAARSRFALPALFVVLAMVAAACNLPTLREARKDSTVLPQTSFLYAADGSLITELHAGEDRVVVNAKNIPNVMRRAVIAIEDQRFYEHAGIDIRALLRAAYIDATSGEIVEGGSTITQQLVKQIFVGDDETIDRKIKEAYLAWQLEHTLTKQEILTKYLNTVYFGHGAYGIMAASRTFFDKVPLDLTVGEAAFLAGAIAAPNRYDPVTHAGRAENRRNRVLVRMHDLGYITRHEYQKTRHAPLELHPPDDDQDQYFAPYFVDYFKQWFLSNPRFGATREERAQLLFEGGLRIVTTVDPRMQRAAEHAISSILTYGSDPYSALTSIDPRTGYVRAMVGGRDYWDDEDEFARINLATGGSTGRQAGSSFKPFALVAALESGLSRSTPLNGSSAHILLQDGTYWDPQNAEGGGYGTISLEQATINSVNVAYANLLAKMGGDDPYIGAAKLVDVATRMGIRCCPRTTNPKGPLAAVPSAVLGVNEINSVEMASAYGTLAYGGQHVQPTPVISITTRDGNVLYQSTPHPDQVVDSGIAAEAVDILKGVVQSGTGTGANIGRPQFGKTGTAQNSSDAWFVGAVPQLVTAVWVGYPQGQISMCCTRIGTVFGGTWPASIWRSYMSVATSRMKVRDFPQPTDSGTITLHVDVTRNCLANPYTPPSDIEVQTFTSGAEPHLETCSEPTSYQDLVVPSVHGLSKEEAIATLRDAGFNVAVEYRDGKRRPDTVLEQDPRPGTTLVQTGTVPITATPAAPPQGVAVVNVIGMRRQAAIDALEEARFDVDVRVQRECDANAPGCPERPDAVWSQAPSDGRAPKGTTITILVNPA
jgi:penicillin-binding protein 1A